jgi:hypothetical protein
MERQGSGPISRARGPSIVASAPMKLLCVLWLLSGRRPDEVSANPHPRSDRAARSN